MTVSWSAHGHAADVTIISREIIDGERDGFFEEVEAKDAATLIVIDRSGPEPKMLLGKRHQRHVFMPGKFVFPGGRVDVADQTMPVAAALHADIERQLLTKSRLRSGNEARAMVLAALRETFEETGLVIGKPGRAAGNIPAGPWSKFVQTGYYPDLLGVHFIARAITPPGFPRRFDARFFCVDETAIAHRIENIVHSDAELVELTWLPIVAARNLNLPVITEIVLGELQSRLHFGLSRNLPVPFYHMQDIEFRRELIQ
jgi:8-oxo-dGTP pyrophosphatase MutT (NUDIX family)